ncbi:putative PEP-CTERM sorting domain-containing protein [Candidatus Magnetomoraceae bacterium gMMP-15]
MKKMLVILSAIALVFGVAGFAGATVLDLNDQNNLGVTYDNFEWNEDNIGGHGGYFYWDNYTNEASVILSLNFSDDIFIESFEMTPFTSADDSNGSFGNVNITAYDTADQLLGSVNVLFESTVSYNWNNWELVELNISEIKKLVFDLNGAQFNPSIDNINIVSSDNSVPEPATMLLLTSGLIGLVWVRKRYKFKK